MGWDGMEWNGKVVELTDDDVDANVAYVIHVFPMSV